jgi:hypothetical protein
MSATQSVERVDFPCEEWVAARNRDTGELVALDPVPGTWTLIGGEDRRRFADRGMNVKAMFACPRCNQIGVIPEGFKPPVSFGDTVELPEMHCRHCKFGCRVVLKDWDKRRLYCAAYETRGSGKDKGATIENHKEYLHAENETEAKVFFWAAHGDGKVTNLVGIAPVVGFFAKDKSERLLIV